MKRDTRKKDTSETANVASGNLFAETELTQDEKNEAFDSLLGLHHLAPYHSFPLTIQDALSGRPIVKGIPKPGTQFKQVYLPFPAGATFTDGTPILAVGCFAISCEWLTAGRREDPEHWNGKATEPAALRLDDSDRPGEPMQYLLVILPEDPAEAEIAYRALIEAVQTSDGSYFPQGLGEITGPCTAWGVKLHAETGDNDNAGS